MHRRSDLIVAAARACVGTRFRPQGRTPGLALDCVGVALVAAHAAGVAVDVPPYDLGGDGEPAFDALPGAAGFVPLDPARAAPGDLLILAPSPGRRHLAVITPAGIVHAHAGIGRVVEAPADPAWATVAAWRYPERNI